MLFGGGENIKTIIFGVIELKALTQFSSLVLWFLDMASKRAVLENLFYYK